MRKLVLFVFLSVFFVAKLFAQTDTSAFRFLNHLVFKNGKARITIKAIYRDFHRSGDEPEFLKMSQKKKLRYKDYFLSCCGGSAISFRLPASSELYDIVMRQGIQFDINHSKPGDVMYLTCLVFEGEKQYNGDPFLVVTNISDKAD
ncbi:hypothetical protein [Mucilaginibacter gotjawali]|uniref:DUF4952 domain-containing protein n=1 Tax=Mucilaginibacter gotjawali TaxID=1550579 RepID=A0A839SM58_9SPHI|nr:hypothetical protein [Mucilaginibacter gotjawali]MBB3058966.1 hypothetical protein [Mucilaginibacter gotjawali]